MLLYVLLILLLLPSSFKDGFIGLIDVIDPLEMLALQALLEVCCVATNC